MHARAPAFLQINGWVLKQVVEAFVSYDRHTGRPRGFGFVIFEDPAVADKVSSIAHTIDRREVNRRSDISAGPQELLHAQAHNVPDRYRQLLPLMEISYRSGCVLITTNGAEYLIR